MSKGVKSSGSEAEDTCAIRGDVPMMVARDLLDPRVCPAMVDQLSTNKATHLFSESRTARRELTSDGYAK
jgi:hypothetical protein